MTPRTVSPSPSYHLQLPEEICEQYDNGVSSYWMNGSSLLLQLSSYVRGKGDQIKAQDRLRERMAKHAETWKVLKVSIHPDVLDQASAEFVDENGLRWIHAYLVWPHLTIYATISGPKELLAEQDNWAVKSFRSVQLTVH